MKLHVDSHTGLNTVTAYGEGFVEVNRQRHAGAVTFAPNGPVHDWPAPSVAEITAAMLLQAAGLPEPAPANPLAALDAPGEAPAARARQAGDVEVVLLGTGARQQFPQSHVLRPLLLAGVGVEVMDTQAAARTYNILMAEGRHVVAILLPA